VEIANSSIIGPLLAIWRAFVTSAASSSSCDKSIAAGQDDALRGASSRTSRLSRSFMVSRHCRSHLVLAQ
jgi:hypothetical protein